MAGNGGGINSSPGSTNGKSAPPSTAARRAWNSGISTETLALFIRFWLTITPPLPNDTQATAQLKGRERYEGFIEALGRRLGQGKSLLQEIPEDIFPTDASKAPDRSDDI
jgi:hypothetical protein